jgi:hypothetical protein
MICLLWRIFQLLKLKSFYFVPFSPLFWVLSFIDNWQVFIILKPNQQLFIILCIQNMFLYGMGGNVLIILPNVKPNKKIAFHVDFIYF